MELWLHSELILSIQIWSVYNYPIGTTDYHCQERRKWKFWICNCCKCWSYNVIYMVKHKTNPYKIILYNIIVIAFHHYLSFMIHRYWSFYCTEWWVWWSGYSESDSRWASREGSSQTSRQNHYHQQCNNQGQIIWWGKVIYEHVYGSPNRF